MKNSVFQDNNWIKSHVTSIRNKAGARYTPELNVDLPISEIFDGISRTERFYIKVRKYYGRMIRDFNHISQRYENRNIQHLYNCFKEEFVKLAAMLKKVKGYSSRTIPWDLIGEHAIKAINTLQVLSYELREEGERISKERANEKKTAYQYSSNIFSSSLHHIHRAHEELQFFSEFSSSVEARLSNIPFLILRGSAGTGKTHLLCDVIEERASCDVPLPGALVFGEFFATNEDPFIQIIRQLKLDLTKTQFLRQLNQAGRQANSRSILAIDALNETRNRHFWKRNLRKVVEELKRYPHIALVVSVRTGFKFDVIPQIIENAFIDEIHPGFEFREWEAVNTFFNEFRLPLPEIPLLMPEFQNPLFLLLFCKAFQRREARNIKAKKQRQIFRGHEGATYIFEAFVDSVSKRIAREFNIPTSPGKNLWDMVIEKIAARMIYINDDRITEDEVITLVRAAYPHIDHAALLKELERNLLLVKIPRPNRNSNDEFDFRFPFQKFSDHLLGRYLFISYEREFWKDKKNIDNAKRFFSRRRKLGKFLYKSWNRGLIEALSIQCPEHLDGTEFVEVAPYLKHKYYAQNAFVDSLLWRKPTAFSRYKKPTLDYINSVIARTRSGHDQLLNAFLAVSSVPEHPFNADFLHNHLTKTSLARRDSWWSTFLHHQYGNKDSVDRLVAWAWTDYDKSHINDDSIRLCSVALSWFLTTPNRFLRDRATKSLVSLLTNRLSVVISLLKQFKSVNDPYVSERLYSVAYGCAIRSKAQKKELRTLAKWVYDDVFKNGSPPAHILLRDYARGIIEAALEEKIDLKISWQKIIPPYHSKWPKRVPSEKRLREKYYPDIPLEQKPGHHGYLSIWSSVMYSFGTMGDFGNYVVNSAVGHWSGRKLGGTDKNRKQLFENFKRNLTSAQNTLLRKATSRFWNVDISNLKMEIIFVTFEGKEVDECGQEIDKERLEKEEIELQQDRIRHMTQFENSLSPSKKRFFQTEIKPFLDDRESISDPLENIDVKIAQRWLFHRVIKLGWSPDLHGEFDSMVNHYRTDRSAHKPERIGKKYQWIAFHELLARISDNFEYKDDRWSDMPGKYEGPWQFYVRDIDPTCTIKETPKQHQTDTPSFKGHQPRARYDAWGRDLSDSQWLRTSNDLPNPKPLIEYADRQGVIWVSLECHLEWQEETPPEFENYSISRRMLWYMLKSYLVRLQDHEKVFRWAKRQNFMGRWMPESHEFTNIFIGEYPWAPAFRYHDEPYYHHDGWSYPFRGRKSPGKVLVTNDEYRNEVSSKDCSTEDSIQLNLPAKLIINQMKLVHPHMDGRFFDRRGNLVAFDPSIFNRDFPSSVLFRKEYLSAFLKRRKYGIVWTLLGEKQLIGGNVMGQPLGWLEINGAYTLTDKNRINGRKHTDFKGAP